MYKFDKEGGHERVRFKIDGHVFMAFAGRNVWIIERERLARVWIQVKPDDSTIVMLCWLCYGEEEHYSCNFHRTELGSDKKIDRCIASEIYDSIVFESADIVWTEDDAGNWKQTKDLACQIVENGGPYQILDECVHVGRKEFEQLALELDAGTWENPDG